MDSSSSSCSSGRLRCQTSLQVNLTVCRIPEKWCRFTVQTANGPENQTRVSFKDVHASFLNSMSSTQARQQFEKWKINNHKTIFMCCWYPRWNLHAESLDPLCYTSSRVVLLIKKGPMLDIGDDYTTPSAWSSSMFRPLSSSIHLFYCSPPLPPNRGHEGP